MYILNACKCVFCLICQVYFTARIRFIFNSLCLLVFVVCVCLGGKDSLGKNRFSTLKKSS